METVGPPADDAELNLLHEWGDPAVRGRTRTAGVVSVVLHIVVLVLLVLVPPDVLAPRPPELPEMKRVVTPLIGLRKSEIVRLGVELGAPLHVSWSCYSGEAAACGVCESCALRLRAFRQAGCEDPIPYAQA